MKIIGCVGYHGTGAGVIDDLLRECDNVAHGGYECESRFLHDADGISDLEYNLVENPHRLNSGFAVRRFLKYAEMNNRQLSKVYGSSWLKLAKAYANSITKFEYEGYKGWEVALFPLHERICEKLQRTINKVLPKNIRKPAWYNYYPNAKTLHSVCTENEFLEKTRLFVNELSLCIPHKKNDEFVVMDQLIPGKNLSRYIRYIPNAKVIIVDRDPRDLYIRQRTLRDHVLPNNVMQFCEYYKDIRPQKNVNETPSNILFVTFEDMIYNYDNMIKKVFAFLGINLIHHISPKSFFNPDKSIVGTRMWLKYPEYTDDIKIIEKMLPEFLYNY